MKFLTAPLAREAMRIKIFNRIFVASLICFMLGLVLNGTVAVLSISIVVVLIFWEASIQLSKSLKRLPMLLCKLLKWLAIFVGVMLLVVLFLAFLIFAWQGILLGVIGYFIFRFLIAEPLNQHFKNQERIIEALESKRRM